MSKDKIYLLCCIIFITTISLWIRVSYFQQTFIDTPVRGDAANYVQYAQNLINYGVFSKSRGSFTPQPDSYWSPGYPTFIAASWLIANRLTIHPYPVTMWAQIIVGVLISILTLLIGRLFLTKGWENLPALMVSLSPHLISMGGYLLTETVFSFLLLAAIYFFSLAFINKKWWSFLSSGLLFGLSYLVNPVMFFTPIFLMIAAVLFIVIKNTELYYLLKYKAIAFFVIFFLVVGAWSFRNAVSVGSGQPSSSNRLFVNLVIGSHRDYFDIWRANPRDPNNPADKDIEVFKGSYSAFTSSLLEKFKNNPASYVKWYIIEKPVLLWSWNILVGQGDIFVYPVKESMYSKSKFAYTTYSVMKFFHYWLLGLAFIGAFFLFVNKKPTFSTPIFLYVTLFYISSVYIITQSEPRYSIPLRPEMYLCAVFLISRCSDYIRAKRIYDYPHNSATFSSH